MSNRLNIPISPLHVRMTSPEATDASPAPRLLAIGDIHGSFASLEALLASVCPQSGDRIITLGDYVDRGPRSKEVLDWLIDQESKGVVLPLRGNHEIMMLDARAGSHFLRQWLSCGGQQVLASFGVDRLEEIPGRYWEFLERTRSCHVEGDYFFVHANAVPDLPLDEQPDYMLFWEFIGEPRPHRSGKTMICGHSSQKSGIPLAFPHAVCIDTFAHGGGWLTCLEVSSSSGRYWQANEQGETREDFLPYWRGSRREAGRALTP